MTIFLYIYIQYHIISGSWHGHDTPPPFAPFSAKAPIPRCPGSTCRTRRPLHAPRARAVRCPAGSWSPRSRGRRLRGVGRCECLGDWAGNTDIHGYSKIFSSSWGKRWSRIKLLILWMSLFSIPDVPERKFKPVQDEFKGATKNTRSRSCNPPARRMERSETLRAMICASQFVGLEPKWKACG